MRRRLNKVRSGILLVIFSLSGCQTTNVQNDSVQDTSRFSLVSQTAINEMGAEQFAKMKNEYSVSSNEQFRVRVDCVFHQLLTAVKNEPDGTVWEFVVFADRTPNIIAVAGGKIAVYDGMSLIAETPDELAAALATSVSQITLRFINRRLSIAIMGGEYASQSFSNEEYLMADSAGRKLMVAAGFDPEASISLLQKFAERDGNSSINQVRLAAAKEDFPALQARYESLSQTGNVPSCR